MDILYIYGYPLLLVVEDGAMLHAAKVFPKHSTKSILEAFTSSWATIYTGLPNRLLVEQGTEFGDVFVRIAVEDIFDVSRTVIEADSILGLVQRYNKPIKTTFRKLRH